MSAEDGAALTRRYHERTKHGMGRYARSLGFMDWETQPDPFRRFEGAPLVVLDEVPVADSPSFDEMLSPAALEPAEVGPASLSQLFQDALGISAWKSFPGHRWSLRSNPSSGNLHPTEGYLVAGPGAGLAGGGGLFHYSPLLHALERRVAIDEPLWRRLIDPLPEDSLLVGLTSIHWRESWKYGERAFRYCQHDVGHAIAAISYAAAAMGWQARLLEAVSDEQLEGLLRLDGQEGPEREHADGVLLLAPARRELTVEAPDWRPGEEALAELRAAERRGTPNRLSSSHHDWPILDEVARATVKREGGAARAAVAEGPAPSAIVERAGSARAVLRGRRSAVELDGVTWIDDDALYRMLAAALPSSDRPPLAALPWLPSVHLALFVHRVRGVEPGLYMLVRRDGAKEPLREACSPELEWARADGAPEGVPLFRLMAGDLRGLARALSCRQDIAADGAFAVAMVSELGHRLDEDGPWFYRRLYWEAGAIGQVLYDEAEAAGVRATGIGCYFDDEVHEVLGLDPSSPWQVLYHLTVGGPVEDRRLGTLPAYHHRADLLKKLRTELLEP